MADNNLPPDPSNYDPSNQAAFNKFAKDNAKIAAEITNEARSLTEELKDQLGIRSRLNETEKSTLNLARQLQNSAAQNTVEIGNSGNIQRQITKDRRIALNIEREINDLKSTASVDEIKFAKKISATNDKINEIQQELAESTGKRSEDLKDQLGIQEDILKFSLEDAKSSTQRLALAMSMSKTTAKLIAQRGVESDIQDKITDRMGVTGALVKGTGALMERLGMRSGIFQKAMTDSAESMRDMAEQTERGEESFSKTEIMLKGLSKLSQGFGKALFDPFTIATAILDAFFKINKLSVETSRLTGQSAFTNGILEFESGAASALDRMEVLNELTKELGMNAQNLFSKESLQGAANLKVEMGLAGKEAGNLAILAQTSGTSVGDLTDNIVSTTSAFNGANRSAVSQGMILRDIGNTSEGIRASFTGNTQELVKGAAAARRLGMSIGELDSIASSLLDFESSIESELEAQLLTGKNINMSKARELALSNDLAGLGKELMKNSSDIHDFGKMNRIQQEAQAKALGMTRDQLAKVAYNRALELGMTNDQAAAAANVNAEDMKRLTAQENFTKAIEKITTALAPILNFIGDILSMPLAPYILLGALAVKKLGGNLLGVFGNLGKLSLGANNVALNLGKMKSNAGEFFQSFRNFKPKEFISGLKKTFGMGANIVKDARLPSGFRDKKTGQAVSKKLGEKVFGPTKVPDSLNKTGDTVGDLGKKTKDIKADSGAGIRGFLKGLGDGLASIGRQIGDVIKGSIAIGVAGLALGGSFALALKMVKDVDPTQMLAFAGSLSTLGLTLAVLGKVGGSIIQGALAMGILGIALIPAAYGFSLLKDINPGQMFAFAGALTLLGLAAAGLGFLFPFIATGAGAIALLGASLIPAALAFNLLGNTPIDSIISKLTGLAAIAPQLLLVGAGLMGIAAGLGMLAISGIAAIPALAALSAFALVASPLAALGGLFGDGEEEDNSMAEISSKLDTLISVVSAGGNVYLDGDKVGEAQVLGTYKLS
jgi:hypothetical protein